jgi:ankyrin repeat protein
MVDKTYKFIKLCGNGDLIGAQQMLEIPKNSEKRKPVNIFAKNDSAFHDACQNGHLPVAQWLLQIAEEKGHHINISFNNNITFRMVCLNGHLHVAQWLLQVVKEIRQSVDLFNIAFLYACYKGHLEVAQWLLQVKPDIDISADNEWAFRCACENGYFHVAKWLQCLKPYLYGFVYDENGKIEKYVLRIRSKEEIKKEQNWHQRKYLVWLASNACPEQNKGNLLYKLPFDVSRMVIGFV